MIFELILSYIFNIGELLSQFMNFALNAIYALASMLVLMVNTIPFLSFIIGLVPGIVGVGVATALTMAIFKILAKAV